MCSTQQFVESFVFNQFVYYAQNIQPFFDIFKNYFLFSKKVNGHSFFYHLIMNLLLYLSIFLVQKEVILNTGLITLLDSDSEYVKQLGAYLETHTNIGYKSSVFTDVNSFIEFSSSNHSDILLINQTLFNNIPLHKLSFDNLFLLGENKSDNCIIRDEISYDIFFKYQSAEHLTHKIMSNLSVHKIYKKNDSSKSSVHISGIYSPVKRCGRTCFSIALAMTYSLKSPTLFITFDENIQSIIQSDSVTGDLSDLLFYFIESPESIHSRLNSMTYSINGIDFIPASKFIRDIRQLDSVVLGNFILALCSTNYDHIVIDFSDTISDILPLLKLCSDIFMPALKDVLSQAKISSFFNSAKEIDSNFNEEVFNIIYTPLVDISDDGTSYINQIMISPLTQFINTHILGHNNDR